MSNTSIPITDGSDKDTKIAELIVQRFAWPKPGEAMIITLPGNPNTQQIAAFRERLQTFVPPPEERGCIIVTGTLMDIKVITEREADVAYDGAAKI